VKVMVVPTNEELAIARDTARILSSLAPRPAADEAAAEPVRPAAFGADETAKLVLLWARNRKAGPAALALKWGKEIGRPVGADEVRRELERLSLAAAAPPPGRARKTH
jgi:hypothetical protein